MKDRSLTPAAPIESVANTVMVCQMGNVAWKTGREVLSDAAAGQFKDDAEANPLITPATARLTACRRKGATKPPENRAS